MELIEILKKYADEANEKCCIAIKKGDKNNQMFEAGRCAGYSVAMKIIKENSKEQPKTNKWIPVSERNPNMDEYLKNDGRFIVTDGNRVYQSIYDIYSSHCFRTLVLFDFGSGSNFEVDNCVVAWMPLPPAYKE